MKIIQRPIENFNERPENVTPSVLVLHYTETKTLAEAEECFRQRNVSAHYMIDYDGTIYQYVDEEKRAWHAGQSWWGGRENVNNFSIGIEIVNPGHAHGYRAFPAAQMDALKTLSLDIMKRHHIAPYNVVAHSDIAPDRKKDPGELFPWELLARHGVGVWPEALGKEDYRMADDYIKDTQSLRDAFTRAGYPEQVSLEEKVIAFNRRFNQDAFRSTNDPKAVTREMAAKLHWLVRNRPFG